MAKSSILQRVVRNFFIKKGCSWQTHSFAYCFRPIYIVSRILGLIPFSIAFRSNGEMQKPKMSKIDFVWFAIYLSLLFYGLSLAFGMVKLQQSSSKDCSLISILGDSGMILLGLIITTVAIVLNFCNRRELVEIFKDINTFDKEASGKNFPAINDIFLTIGISRFYRFNRWVFISIISKNIVEIGCTWQ